MSGWLIGAGFFLVVVAVVVFVVLVSQGTDEDGWMDLDERDAKHRGTSRRKSP